MSFWNRDLQMGDKPRQKLQSRDWLFLSASSGLAWALTVVVAHWIEGDWVIAMFSALLPAGFVVFMSISTWWYPSLSDNSPRQSGLLAVGFVVFGAIVLGFEIHAGQRNLYEVLAEGIPAGAHWDTNGIVGPMLLCLAYVTFSTAARRALWLKLDTKHGLSNEDTQSSSARRTEAVTEAPPREAANPVAPSGGGVHSGSSAFTATLRTFAKHPTFLIPMLLCWAVYAPAIIYLKYFFDWGALTVWESLGVAFALFLGLSISISFASLTLLEFIEQIETGRKVNVFKGIGRALADDLLPALPIALVWAFVWFLLTLVEVIVSRFQKGTGSEGNSFSMENAAKTLSGYHQFSLGGAVVEAVNQGVRMIAFLIFPAIAWERDGPRKAFRRGLGIAETHKAAFATGIALTFAAAAVVFLPPALIFEVVGRDKMTLPNAVWVALIIYIGFAWSFSMLTQQLFAATLYRWHLDWEQKCRDARSKGLAEPHFKDVPCPSIVDHAGALFDESQI